MLWNRSRSHNQRLLQTMKTMIVWVSVIDLSSTPSGMKAVAKEFSELLWDLPKKDKAWSQHRTVDNDAIIVVRDLCPRIQCCQTLASCVATSKDSMALISIVASMQKQEQQIARGLSFNKAKSKCNKDVKTLQFQQLPSILCSTSGKFAKDDFWAYYVESWSCNVLQQTFGKWFAASKFESAESLPNLLLLLEVIAFDNHMIVPHGIDSELSTMSQGKDVDSECFRIISNCKDGLAPPDALFVSQRVQLSGFLKLSRQLQYTKNQSEKAEASSVASLRKHCFSQVYSVVSQINKEFDFSSQDWIAFTTKPVECEQSCKLNKANRSGIAVIRRAGLHVTTVARDRVGDPSDIEGYW